MTLKQNTSNRSSQREEGFFARREKNVREKEAVLWNGMEITF